MKIWTILLSVIISVVIILPSVLPEDSPLREYLPSKTLNLGLDLKGGIHVVLGVDIEKALSVEVDKFQNDLQTALTDKQIPFQTVERSSDPEGILVRFRDEPSADQLRTLLQEDFYQVLTISDWQTPTSALVTLEPTWEEKVAKDSLEQARQIIRNRVDEFGVAEPIIQIQGDDRILVQLPGVQDPERALQLIGKTALLEFKVVDETLDRMALEGLIEKVREKANFKNNFTAADLARLNEALKPELPAGTIVSFEKETDRRSREVTLVPYLLRVETVLTGQALEDARVVTNPTTQQPEASLRFNKKGAQAFESITAKNVGKLLAIVLDGVVMSAPVIREKIPAAGAGATISLGADGTRMEKMNEARDLALVLRSGALPAPVEVLENRTVGASLGEDSVEAGKMAAMIALGLVVIFMLIYYRASGIVADFTLLLNLLVVMAIMALFQATLTLPGIAGIVLTVGMAVDANVIILERIREELKKGKKVRAAIESGYESAKVAIFDANLTTIIAGVVLFNFGIGPIRGFAVTLLIGVFSSFVTSVWFSRWIYEWVLDRYSLKRLSI